MAKRIPNPSERLLRINHRELLSTAVGVTAASLVLDVPLSELAHAASAETAAWEGPTFSARSFLEITRRNQLRHEAKLPLLKVSKEWRRMKAAENVRRYSETFGKFVGENSEAVWVEVFTPIRKANGDPNWKPKCCSEGVGYQSEVYRILRERFEAERKKQ